LRHPYPFSAVLGQDAVKRALLLNAIDPGIGGVLIEGPRGMAKTTLARGLADLLPEGRFVDLPLGASEDRLVGSLDLDRALGAGEVRFSPGLLAQAHGGVLYVDEVNLLPDHLVDLLLDVAASGVNVVERDGISHRHPARFVLVGTMNPDEGELRPQLLDRFGLSVALEEAVDLDTRARISRARLAYEADPAAFLQRYREAQQALRDRLRRARRRLPEVTLPDALYETAARRALEAGVEGMRADLVMLRGARAQAAWEGRETATEADLEAVAEAALRHRRRERAAPPPPAVPPEPAPGDERAGRAADRRGPHGPPPSAGLAPNEDWGELPPEPVPTPPVWESTVPPLGEGAGKKKA